MCIYIYLFTQLYILLYVLVAFSANCLKFNAVALIETFCPIYLHVLSIALFQKLILRVTLALYEKKKNQFISVDLLREDIYKNTVNVYAPKIFPFRHLQGRTGTFVHPGEICWGK